MADVVALVADRVLRARIAEAARPAGCAVFCERVADVLPAVEAVGARHARVGAIVLEPRDRDGVPCDALVGVLRARLPAAPVLAYCSPPGGVSGTPSDEILRMARAGVSGLLLRGVDDAGAALRHALVVARDDCAARLVMRELEPVLPRPARAVVEHCVLHGREPLTVAGVAAALGVHRKTLVLRLRAAGLPEPRAVLAWIRLCLVAHALDESGVSIERIAMDFGYPSAPALRNLCKRLTGLRLSEIRDGGGLTCVVRLFTRTLDRTTDRAASLTS